MAGRGHPRSWYAETALPQPDHPPLAGDLRCDVCVVGGGYTGLSAALHLAERGYDVVLLEAERIGWGASGRNGGQIVTAYNPSMGTMAGWVGKDDARLLWDLGEESKRILTDRVERHGIQCDLRWGYVLAALKQRQLAGLRELGSEWSDDYGYHEARLLDRDEIRSMVASDAYVGGLFDGGSGQLHPLNYAIGLGRAAAEAGVRIFEGSRVERLDTGAAPAAHTAAGTVRADYLILAGNAYLGGLVPELAAKIMPVATYMIATEPLGEERAASLIPCGHAVADVNFVLNYYRRSPDHRLLFGGGVSYSGLDRPDLKRILRRTMLRYFPQLADAGIDHCWGGHVAITLNRTPHFGRIGSNTYFAQGYSGHGVALTGLAGKLIAEAVGGTAERFDVLARLPHRRFPGGPARMPLLVLAMAWFRLRDLL
ncbi:FAD-binding oxidoreductase [Skermanella mucosa]|uniref:NAD(P)/FAD-dependent oxidoreductase n=1 Tax=Skermanella mucosa TaxID=1789672 RepID=UPI00192BE586|nr:FAD-binding oxidoreductase [Skermanella mucosa]UEM19546.1 FAD-binding oxidoreductase [Skermanella mucosa]